MKQNNLSPSKELYLKVRAGFIARGTSLHKWCDEQGIKPSNARIALIGGWDGPKGKALRNQLIKESGISAPSRAA